MTAISEEEAKEFDEKINEGYRLLKKGRKIISKDNKTENDINEIARIENRLNDIEHWFKQTGKF